MKEKLPQRKNVRIKGFDYSNQGYYFITICTKNRECILSKIIEEVKNNKKTCRGRCPHQPANREYTKNCRGRRPRRPANRKYKN